MDVENYELFLKNTAQGWVLRMPKDDEILVSCLKDGISLRLQCLPKYKITRTLVPTNEPRYPVFMSLFISERQKQIGTPHIMIFKKSSKIENMIEDIKEHLKIKGTINYEGKEVPIEMDKIDFKLFQIDLENEPQDHEPLDFKSLNEFYTHDSLDYIVVSGTDENIIYIGVFLQNKEFKIENSSLMIQKLDDM